MEQTVRGWSLLSQKDALSFCLLPCILQTRITSEKQTRGKQNATANSNTLSENPSATLKIEMIAVDRTGKLFWEVLQSKVSSKTSLYLESLQLLVNTTR